MIYFKAGNFKTIANNYYPCRGSSVKPILYILWIDPNAGKVEFTPSSVTICNVILAFRKAIAIGVNRSAFDIFASSQFPIELEDDSASTGKSFIDR